MRLESARDMQIWNKALDLAAQEAKRERVQGDQYGTYEGKLPGGDDIAEDILRLKVKDGLKRNLRLLVIGHARHGKDTVGDMLRDLYGFKSVPSSWFMAERVVRPWLEKHEGITYPTVEACYADRANHRAGWFQAINEYNTPDLATLGKAIWAENDVYCGLRHKSEFCANRNAKTFDVAIWVDRSDHVGPEDRSSMTLEPWMADYMLDNNRTLDDLRYNLIQLMRTLGYEPRK